MVASTISIIQGEDVSRNLVFEKADGAAYDSTGCSIAFEVRRSPRTDPILTKPTSVSTLNQRVGGDTLLTIDPTIGIYSLDATRAGSQVVDTKDGAVLWCGVDVTITYVRTN